MKKIAFFALLLICLFGGQVHSEVTFSTDQLETARSEIKDLIQQLGEKLQQADQGRPVIITIRNETSNILQLLRTDSQEKWEHKYLVTETEEKSCYYLSDVIQLFTSLSIETKHSCIHIFESRYDDLKKYLETAEVQLGLEIQRNKQTN